MLNKLGPDRGPDQTECYIGHDFGTVTSEFRVAVGFRVMRNIIPNTSSDLEHSGTSRKLFVFESRAVIFSVSYLLT